MNINTVMTDLHILLTENAKTLPFNNDLRNEGYDAGMQKAKEIVIRYFKALKKIDKED